MPPPNAGTILALKQCQELLKQQLTRARLGLFRELTGLHLHVWWHEPMAEWQLGDLPQPCPRSRQRPAGRRLERCDTCLRKRWPQAWNRPNGQKRFAGLCGAINYCACVKVGELRAVTLTVQQTAAASRAAQRTFLHAVSLARLIVHDLQTTLETARASAQPHSLPPNLGVQASCLSRQPKEPRQKAGETPALRWSRSQQMVERMLDYIHEHYARPIQLSDLAATVKLRSTYVSSLFSETLGVTFHHYLEQFRLARAKDLLRDPVMRVSEVAYAVGYANPNHFRNVFTVRVGLPPSAWRETSDGRG